MLIISSKVYSGELNGPKPTRCTSKTHKKSQYLPRETCSVNVFASSSQPISVYWRLSQCLGSASMQLWRSLKQAIIGDILSECCRLTHQDIGQSREKTPSAVLAWKNNALLAMYINIETQDLLQFFLRIIYT